MFLRRFARPLMMMSNVEATTGVVEQEVVQNARQVLIDIYTKTLDEVKAVPEKEPYRKTVETDTIQRLKVCQEEEDWEKIQERIGSAKEEIINEAKDELRRLGNMNKWKPWSVVDSGPPKPKPKYKTGPLPPEFYAALKSVAIKAEQNRVKREAEEVARKEAEELEKKEAEELAEKLRVELESITDDAEPSELVKKLREDLKAITADAKPSSKSSSGTGTGTGSV